MSLDFETYDLVCCARTSQVKKESELVKFALDARAHCDGFSPDNASSRHAHRF
ncbi:BgTH12-01568 [Blumeria graminis f. sp. triticale]|uniref:BgTH12-01568 n=1 Tax=Blumeria graminis f. sp. triticale TaxID=1689686 RepID=A0A9W4CZF5_BLUGR|nr:BgTH12-01568 [Blumeria graminis f. sp. triticale]